MAVNQSTNLDVGKIITLKYQFNVIVQSILVEKRNKSGLNDLLI